MAIIGSLPITLVNGTTADATQVMADFNYIVTQINLNAAEAGVNTNITSLTGLTTPLGISFGGTGADTIEEMTAIPWAIGGGSANAITATYVPAVTGASLVDGTMLGFRATAANTSTAPTFSPNGTVARTITKAGGQPLSAGDIPGNLAECLLRYNLANTRWELVNAAVPTAAVPNLFPQGRLTLSSAQAVMVSNVTAATVIYYTAYIGNQVPVFNGTVWVNAALPANEISLTLDSNSGHTGYQQSGKLYDLFIVIDSGTVRLVTGPAWATTTSRGSGAGTTELTRVAGVAVNANQFTVRYGALSTDTLTIAAQSATYVGTMYATADGQTGMNFKPAAAAGGANNILGLYNGYNRARTFAENQDSTSTWVYSTATWRPLNGAAANVNNRISFIDGLQQSFIKGRVDVGVQQAGGVVGRAGINLDSTSATPGSLTGIGGNINLQDTPAEANFFPQLGLHFIQAMEIASGSSVTFQGVGSELLTLQIDM